MSDSKFKIKNSQKGITLIEIVVVVFIIALFTVILVSDFPRVLRQMGLSRVAYNFAQNLRKAQDLGLSGIQLNDFNGATIAVKGYGVYINLSSNNKQYVIYADVASEDPVTHEIISNQKYGNADGTVDLTYPRCSEVKQADGGPNILGGHLVKDCIVDIISLIKEDSSLFIKPFVNILGDNTSINFSPPGPITTISILTPLQNKVGVIFRNSDGGERAVYINSSGLIDVP